MNDVELWRELGQQLRVDAIRPAAKAGSGHPTSGMSAADLMAVLMAKYLRYDFDNPHDPHNDRLVFSKGHASTLMYAMFRAAGAISEEELLTYRQFDSIFEGHPTPRIPWVDVATGSLGQGLPYAVGMAIAGKRLDRLPFRVWTLCGDSEIAEGSQWEALEHAAFYELDNLVAILDVNRLGQRGETMHGWDLDSYASRARAFGCHTIEIDGHDGDAIDRAYAEATDTAGQPVVTVAKTIKGKGHLDGEVSNSTFADEFRDAIPERYFEMYIAEQQMVATAVGMQVLGWRPFASTFAAFLSRAYDFIRMSAISRASYCLCGSHAGVSIGEDGPSQMALEDIAALRAVHGSTVLHPCDANQTAKLVERMADVEGIAYLRTLRPNTPVIYGPDEDFEIGGSRTVRQGDDVAIVGAGITVHEALKAADAPAKEGIEARVIDLYSIKPLDAETLRSLTCPIVTAEDHWAEGGLGEAVLSALSDSDERPPVARLAVHGMPHSGKPAELLAEA